MAEGACPVETDPAVEVTCGTIAVPTDHDDPDGDTIDLAVAILPAADDSEATPIFLLGGGPGEHAVVPLLEMLAPDAPFLELAASRDVVVIDQRGAGASMPALECPEFQEELAEVTETAEIGRASIEAITVCRERLDGEGVDLSAFDTAAGVADLEAVRRALGYETVSLFGTSYGARLALQATREYPDTIESAALSSPIPAEENFVVDSAESFDRAITAIGDECAADPMCRDAYPDVTGNVRRLLEQFDAEPAMVDVTDPASGEEFPVPVDGASLATILFGLFYAPDGPATFPFLVTSLAEGDLSGLEGLASQPAPVVLSQGQQLSFLCAEEAAVAEPEDVATGDLGAGSRLVESNPSVGLTLWDLCEVWDVEAGDEETFEPVDTEVPLLVVTGQFDQITPPAYGETVADAADTAWYVEVPGVGHAPLTAAGECGLALLDAFVAQPTEEPDAGCVGEGPGFATPEEIADQANPADPADPTSPSG